MSRLLRPVALAAALSLVAFPAARAQQADAPSPAPAVAPVAAPAVAAEARPDAHLPVAAPAGATREASSAVAADEAFRTARSREAGVAVVQGASRGSGKLYMIVGGAAFLAGAIIGDDAGTIIMIGGAGLGIYGLYLYLR